MSSVDRAWTDVVVAKRAAERNIVLEFFLVLVVRVKVQRENKLFKCLVKHGKVVVWRQSNSSRHFSGVFAEHVNADYKAPSTLSNHVQHVLSKRKVFILEW